jgi:hypothetical protein
MDTLIENNILIIINTIIIQMFNNNENAKNVKMFGSYIFI